jgi:hypothetical protein
MRLLVIPALVALLPGICAAQDDSQDGSTDNTIHAITALNDDGSKTVTITDPDNHSSESSTYDAANKLIEKVVYTLDENSNPVTGTVFGPDNTAVFKATYKHDDYNRITEEDDYTLDGQFMRRFTYDFGSDGKLKQIHAFDSQGNELHQSDAAPDEHSSPPLIH